MKLYQERGKRGGVSSVEVVVEVVLVVVVVVAKRQGSCSEEGRTERGVTGAGVGANGGGGMVVVVIKVSMVVVMELRWCWYHWGRATNRVTGSRVSRQPRE